MYTDPQTFLQLAIDFGVLRFGEFVLKSGRRSPYFFNIGQFNSGVGLMHVGRAYAQAIMTAQIGFDMLYGPAYKGIPLVATTSVALATHHKLDVPYAFNRKEIKDHGEGGIIIGSPLQGRVLILDDVISAGTSVRESVDIIRAYGATPVGVVIALDRQERLPNMADMAASAVTSLELPIVSILKFTHLLEYLAAIPDKAADLQNLQAYQAQYGLSLG